jgi:hypothetical protein
MKLETVWKLMRIFSKIKLFNTYDVFLGLGVELNVPNLEGFFSGGVGVPVFTEFG